MTTTRWLESVQEPKDGQSSENQSAENEEGDEQKAIRLAEWTDVTAARALDRVLGDR